MLPAIENLKKILQKLADEDKLSHAYLFFGPEGAPKETLAFSLAEHLEHNNKTLIDVLHIRPTKKEEGAKESIGKEEVKKIKAFLYQSPIASKKRTVIIQNAETISWQTTPSLLKIIEEPPAHALLILTTHDPQTLSPALLSRLTKIYVPPVKNIDISKYQDISTCRHVDIPTLSLAEELEERIIDLYKKDKLKNAKKIAFLLHKQEMATRFNLNQKLQKKAVEYELKGT